MQRNSIHQARATGLICLAILLAPLACVTQGATLYWDPNGFTTGFGSGGTWGSDASWTTDSSGGFSDGGTATTAAGDEARINEDNLGGFSMDVSGNVDVLMLRSPSTDTSGGFATINGPGTIHVYTSGTGDANSVLGGANDLKFVVNPNLVLEAASGNDVTLGAGGGNNANITYNGSITSTNLVNMLFSRSGHLNLSGAIDLKGGNFISESGGTFRPKDHTVNGVLGSGVHHVDRSGPQGGHTSNKGRLVLANPNNAYTGDTFVDESVIRITIDTSLPDTTRVFLSNSKIGDTNVNNGDNVPLMDLQNPGTDVIAGLYFDGVEQALGTWGSSASGADHTNDIFFSGSGMLNVAPIPEPATALLLALGLLGLVAVGRRRRE